MASSIGTDIFLEQDMLNVTEKRRANFFNWRGQFTPQFVDYLLANFAEEGCVVFDPFSGSGTVLLECARKNLSCYGSEINPAAYAMSKFYTLCNETKKNREGIVAELGEVISQLIEPYHGLPLLENSTQYREKFGNLIKFAEALYCRLSDKNHRILALNMIFAAENGRNADLYSTIIKSLNAISRVLIEMPYTQKPIRAKLADARMIHKGCVTKADLILTSPPYINVFNYHQNHRAVMEVLGWDLLAVAQSEIGSNRKNRGNRFKTMVQYCLDMEQSLGSFWETMADHGRLVLIVGRQSRVRRVTLYNGRIIAELIRDLGCFGKVTVYERQFLNRFGQKIREDIITAQKSENKPQYSGAREVALRHLKGALQRTADPEAKKDIGETISHIDRIGTSPLLVGREVIQNGQNASQR